MNSFKFDQALAAVLTRLHDRSEAESPDDTPFDGGLEFCEDSRQQRR